MQLEWQKRIISGGAGKKQILLDAVLVKGCGLRRAGPPEMETVYPGNDG